MRPEPAFTVQLASQGVRDDVAWADIGRERIVSMRHGMEAGLVFFERYAYRKRPEGGHLLAGVFGERGVLHRVDACGVTTTSEHRAREIDRIFPRRPFWQLWRRDEWRRGRPTALRTWRTTLNALVAAVLVLAIVAPWAVAPAALLPVIFGTMQTWVETLVANIADGTAVATSTTETIIVPDYTFPAGYMYPGRSLRVKIFGRVSATTGTNTMIWKVRWGGVAGVILVASAAVTVTASASNLTWYLEATIICRTIGTTGTFMAIGTTYIGAQTVENLMPASAPAVSPSADTTIAKAFSVTVLWSVSNAANTIQAHNEILEALN